MKMLTDEQAVSHLMGFILILAVESVVIASTAFGVTTIIDDRVERLGNLEAQAVVNEVSDAVTNAVDTHQSYPNMTYTRIIEVPRKIGDRLYYVEITNNYSYVNSTDGVISQSSSNFKPAGSDLSINSRVYASTDKIKVMYKDGDVTLSLK